MNRMTRPVLLEVAGHEVTVTHPDKVVFPRADGHKTSGPYTKLDLVRYYLSVADGALRGVAGRPIILKRFVKGITEEAVFQKRAPAKRPDWVDVAELRYARGTSAAEAVIRDAAGLAWAINLGCVDLFRTRCSPTTSITPTNCASTSIRCPGSPGGASWTSPWWRARCSRTTA